MAEIHQKIISCPNGHYYDANRHASCPHCIAGEFAPTQDPYADNENVPAGGNNWAPTTDPNVGSFGITQPPAPLKIDNMQPTDFVGLGGATEGGVTTMPAPVVGWLVAIVGPCRGTDFRIHTGYNYIGRLEGDICISGDNTISGIKDSVVTFVPQTQKFYISHELGKNVLLVNDLPVIGGAKELRNYDTITIGNTKLKFIGFCGESFQWESEQ